MVTDQLIERLENLRAGTVREPLRVIDPFRRGWSDA